MNPKSENDSAYLMYGILDGKYISLLVGSYLSVVIDLTKPQCNFYYIALYYIMLYYILYRVIYQKPKSSVVSVGET